jgi:hypothetical protein
MPLTNKEQELINCVNNFNTEWKSKMDEMDAIPARFPENDFHNEYIRWEDAEKKMKWKLKRESFKSKYSGREIIYYSYEVRWLYGKGYCRAGDTIKHTHFEIWNSPKDIYILSMSIPTNRLNGGNKYGVPFRYHDTIHLYMDGLIYRLVGCSKPNRPLENHIKSP